MRQISALHHAALWTYVVGTLTLVFVILLQLL
jgi:hypothetical protein